MSKQRRDATKLLVLVKACEATACCATKYAARPVLAYASSNRK
jgi:hypothetical protein